MAVCVFAELMALFSPAQRSPGPGLLGSPLLQHMTFWPQGDQLKPVTQRGTEAVIY